MSRNTIIFTLLIPLVVILFVFDLLSGDTTLSAGQVWNVFTGNETDETTRNIVLSIRLVRVIVAILIGGAAYRCRPFSEILWQIPIYWE